MDSTVKDEESFWSVLEANVVLVPVTKTRQRPDSKTSAQREDFFSRVSIFLSLDKMNATRSLSGMWDDAIAVATGSRLRNVLLSARSTKHSAYSLDGFRSSTQLSDISSLALDKTALRL